MCIITLYRRPQLKRVNVNFQKKIEMFFLQKIQKQAIRTNIIKTKSTLLNSQKLSNKVKMNALNVNTNAKTTTTTTKKAKLYYPRCLTASDFKGLTFAVWIMRRMSNKGLFAVDDEDWMNFLEIGSDCSHEDLKHLYDCFNSEQEKVAEEVSELLKKKPAAKKVGRKSKTTETVAKYEGEATLTEQLLKAAEVEEKPKRKYTRKPKEVIENHAPTAETRLPKEVPEKPKRKYTKKDTKPAEPIAEPIVQPVEQPVEQPIANAEKPKRKYTKKTKDTDATTTTTTTAEPPAKPEIEKPVEEKPKRKTTKKAKEEVKEPTPEPVQVIEDELTKDGFVDQPEADADEDEISVEMIVIEGVKYYLDTNNNLYDIETQEPLSKKYINGQIV